MHASLAVYVLSARVSCYTCTLIMLRALFVVALGAIAPAMASSQPSSCERLPGGVFDKLAVAGLATNASASCLFVASESAGTGSGAIMAVDITSGSTIDSIDLDGDEVNPRNLVTDASGRFLFLVATQKAGGDACFPNSASAPVVRLIRFDSFGGSLVRQATSRLTGVVANGSATVQWLERIQYTNFALAFVGNATVVTIKLETQGPASFSLIFADAPLNNFTWLAPGVGSDPDMRQPRFWRLLPWEHQWMPVHPRQRKQLRVPSSELRMLMLMLMLRWQPASLSPRQLLEARELQHHLQ